MKKKYIKLYEKIIKYDILKNSNHNKKNERIDIL